MRKEIQEYNVDELTRELKIRALNHHNYKYYSKHNVVQSLFSDRSLFLSDGSKWNDRCDRDNFAAHEGSLFAKSFSYRKEENVSMWMLYGDKCQGSLVDFKQLHLKTIIDENKNKELQIGVFESEKFIVTKTLKPNNLFLIDVCYEGSKSSGLVNLYRGDSFYRSTIGDRDRWLVKNYAWENESECRLIVEFSEKFSEKGLFLRLVIPDIVIEDLNKRCFRGPSSSFNVFNKSVLTGKVDWNI